MFTTPLSELPDNQDDLAPGTLVWLQSWYAQKSNGEWEHSRGVKIETIDNPGWSLSIDLQGTALERKVMNSSEIHPSEHDSYVIRREKNTFEAYCGPLNLSEILHKFRVWVDG